MRGCSRHQHREKGTAASWAGTRSSRPSAPRGQSSLAGTEGGRTALAGWALGASLRLLSPSVRSSLRHCRRSPFPGLMQLRGPGPTAAPGGTPPGRALPRDVAQLGPSSPAQLCLPVATALPLVTATMKHVSSRRFLIICGAAGRGEGGPGWGCVSCPGARTPIPLQ